MTYNNDFAVTTQRVNNAAGTEVTYGYDQDGLVTSAGVPGTAFTIVRDETNGVIESATLGAVETRPYLNQYGELDSLTTLVNNAITYRASYVRDALGRIRVLTELMPDSIRVFDYDYDVRGRLIDVKKNNAPIAHYGYDANGNRTSFVGVSPTDTASATYDAQDRLLRYRDTRYEWTQAGELRLKIEPVSQHAAIRHRARAQHGPGRAPMRPRRRVPSADAACPSRALDSPRARVQHARGLASSVSLHFE